MGLLSVAFHLEEEHTRYLVVILSGFERNKLHFTLSKKISLCHCFYIGSLVRSLQD